jgi:hypothetical protein
MESDNTYSFFWMFLCVTVSGLNFIAALTMPQLQITEYITVKYYLTYVPKYLGYQRNKGNALK